MKTIILGSGYLSDNLKKKITNSYIVSANNILEIRNINKKKKNSI